MVAAQDSVYSAAQQAALGRYGIDAGVNYFLRIGRTHPDVSILDKLISSGPNLGGTNVFRVQAINQPCSGTSPGYISTTQGLYPGFEPGVRPDQVLMQLSLQDGVHGSTALPNEILLQRGTFSEVIYGPVNTGPGNYYVEVNVHPNVPDSLKYSNTNPKVSGLQVGTDRIPKNAGSVPCRPPEPIECPKAAGGGKILPPGSGGGGNVLGRLGGAAMGVLNVAGLILQMYDIVDRQESEIEALMAQGYPTRKSAINDGMASLTGGAGGRTGGYLREFAPSPPPPRSWDSIDGVGIVSVKKRVLDRVSQCKGSSASNSVSPYGGK